MLDTAPAVMSHCFSPRAPLLRGTLENSVPVSAQLLSQPLTTTQLRFIKLWELARFNKQLKCETFMLN